ncbi:ABC-type spermidine/putrescine transport system permease subunit II [Bradyrhizobium sp. USDA 4341]
MIWARLRTTGKDYEEAALSLGADEIQATFRVTIPTMMPALIGGLLLAFTASFDEFSATQFIVTPVTQTVPTQVYSMIMTGIEPTVNAFASILIAITVTIPLLAQFLFGAFRRIGPPRADI